VTTPRGSAAWSRGYPCRRRLRAPGLEQGGRARQARRVPRPARVIRRARSAPAGLARATAAPRRGRGPMRAVSAPGHPPRRSIRAPRCLRCSARHPRQAPAPAWDAEHYSASIEEPGWIAAEDVRAPTLPAWDPSHAEAPPWPERDRPEPSELSGSRELDEALAALDALAHPAPGPEPAAGDDTGTPVTTPRSPAAWSRPTPPPPLAMRSSASRAYRRLKRIFPS